MNQLKANENELAYNEATESVKNLNSTQLKRNL